MESSQMEQGAVQPAEAPVSQKRIPRRKKQEAPKRKRGRPRKPRLEVVVAAPSVVRLPERGWLRVKDIIGDRKAGIPAIIPVCESTWWKGVKSGRFPQAHRPFGAKIAAWPAHEIYALTVAPE